jgi:hypothetical protein
MNRACGLIKIKMMNSAIRVFAAKKARILRNVTLKYIGGWTGGTVCRSVIDFLPVGWETDPILFTMLAYHRSGEKCSEDYRGERACTISRVGWAKRLTVPRRIFGKKRRVPR